MILDKIYYKNDTEWYTIENENGTNIKKTPLPKEINNLNSLFKLFEFNSTLLYFHIKLVDKQKSIYEGLINYRIGKELIQEDFIINSLVLTKKKRNH